MRTPWLPASQQTRTVLAGIVLTTSACLGRTDVESFRDRAPDSGQLDAPANDAGFAAPDAGGPPPPPTLTKTELTLPFPTDWVISGVSADPRLPYLAIEGQDPRGRASVRVYWNTPGAERFSELPRPGEARGVHVYAHDVDADSPQFPMLARATERFNRMEYTFSNLAPGQTGVASEAASCPTMLCDECAPTDCERPLGSRVRFRAHDLNRDGWADVSAGAKNGFQLETFFSASHLQQTNGGVSLPPYEFTCACSGHGRLTGAFDVLDLGGPSSVGAPDLVIGDGVGLALIYSDTHNRYGETCFESDAPACGRGLCESSCASQPDRCLHTCVDDQDCDTGTCEDGVCGFKRFRCGQGQLAIRLRSINDVFAANLDGDEHDDVVVLSPGGPVPGAFGPNVLAVRGRAETLLDDDPDKVITYPGSNTEVVAMAVADLDGDGRDEVITLSDEPDRIDPQARLRVWSDPDGAPSETVVPSCIPRPHMAVLDIDQAGRREVAIMCQSRIEIYR